MYIWCSDASYYFRHDLKRCSGGFGSRVTISRLWVHLTSKRRYFRAYQYRCFGDANCFQWLWWDDLSTPVKVCHYHITAPACLPLFGMCLFIFFPPLAACWERRTTAGRASGGPASESQSWSYQSQVPTPVIRTRWVDGKGHTHRGDPQALLNAFRGNACEQRHLPGSASPAQQNTSLLRHTLLPKPVSTVSLTWGLKRSWNAHLSFLGEKKCC